jgi:hypothetical protein
MENVNADNKGLEYTFNDFYLTAYLICGHAKLKKIVVVDKAKKKCGFVLESLNELEPVIRDYFNDKLTVNPQKYKDKIVSLKSLLHETKNKEGLNTDMEENKNG